MSTQVRVPPLAVDHEVELRRLTNMLRLAGSGALAFARVNHPSLRDRLVEQLRASMPDRAFLVVTLDARSPMGIVNQLREAVGPACPDALFVFGLDRFFDPAAPLSDPVGMFNVNHYFVLRRFPYPIVVWTPDFAIQAFRKQAVDFWSRAKSIYRFSGEDEESARTLDEVEGDLDWNVSPEERRQRRELLRDLLRERGDSADRTRILYLLAGGARFESDWDEAESSLRQAAPLFARSGDRLGEANCLYSMARLAEATRNPRAQTTAAEEAAHIYDSIGMPDWAERARALLS
jgi:hypothetical protein